MLVDLYRERIAASRGKFNEDPAQLDALIELERVRATLAAAPDGGGFWRRLFGRADDRPVRGLYLWGGVGRGKTYLMNLFYDALPEDGKRRYHFHRFMQHVHAELTTLRDRQRPLQLVAERIAEDTQIICLDEFFVTDITDAMLLAGLLEALFARAVSLVTTSNLAPDELYRDGLQRARFVPAIELIKTHTTVLEMGGETDYRLRTLRQADLYCCAPTVDCDARLRAVFEEINGPSETTPGDGGELRVSGRDIALRRLGNGVAWFDFVAICDGPRSQTDYIEIARLFHTVLISGVPVLDVNMDNQARRFLNLVDEFYDRNVKLVLAAAAPIADLYQGEKLRFEYRRTRSRLQEMQSFDYLARRHLP